MAAWEQSLQELVRTRGTALVGYAYLLCGDRREAEDLVQDALVKTYARGRVGTHPDNVEGYVRRAILSTFLDGFRRRAAPCAAERPQSTCDARRRCGRPWWGPAHTGPGLAHGPQRFPAIGRHAQ